MRGRRAKKVQQELKGFHESLSTERRWTTANNNNEGQDSLCVINVLIFGPPNTPYEGGTFEIKIELPKMYPQRPPELKMKTKIFHPMINEHGVICLSILDNWGTNNKFVDCLEKMYIALEKPTRADHLIHAHNDNALFLCLDYPDQFEARARECTEKFAMHEVCSLSVRSQILLMNIFVSHFLSLVLLCVFVGLFLT